MTTRQTPDAVREAVAALRCRLDDIRDERHFPAHMLDVHDEMQSVLDDFEHLTEIDNRAGDAGERARAIAEGMAAAFDKLAASTKYDAEDRERWTASRDDAREIATLLATPAPAVDADPAGERRYLADRFQWAAPGDQQEDAWIVRFCDNDVRDMLFTGPDAEREAWEAWERHAPGYNMYVFRLAALSHGEGRK